MYPQIYLCIPDGQVLSGVYLNIPDNYTLSSLYVCTDTNQ